MNLSALKWIALVATSLATLFACSDAGDRVAERAPATSTDNSSPSPLPVVRDSFRVGDDIYVRSLATDADHNVLWVGTSTGVLGIDLTSHDVRDTFTRKDGLANEYVFAIFVDSQGYTWFGTNAGGTSRYRDGKWDVYFPMHGLADYWIYSFAEQQHGPLWIGTWAGANSVDLQTMQFSTYLSELVNEWVYAIDIDAQDRVWFGTEGGISLFDGKDWRHWTHADGLGADNTGNHPASPNTGLGTRSRHDLGVLLAGKETYNPNYVFSLVIDDSDRVWAGTWGGGVGVFDGARWHNFTTSDGLAGNIVYSIAIGADGVYWFGTNHGLSRYDGRTWITYDRHAGLLDDNVYAIATAVNGEIWVGTRRGVSLLGDKDP